MSNSTTLYQNPSELRTAIKTILPLSQIESDNNGQIIIYTGLTVDDDSGTIRELNDNDLDQERKVRI